MKKGTKNDEKLYHNCWLNKWKCNHIVATLALGLRPRQGVTRLPGCRPNGKPGVMLHASGSVRECEGIDLHIPKGTHFGSWSPDGVPNL